MTKNQVTYLLALATLVVGWLYFNTFIMVAKNNQRMNPLFGMGRPMMGDLSQKQPSAMPVFPGMQNGAFVNKPSSMPSGLPALSPEMQKLVKAQKTQGSVPAGKK
ncbi:MAG: hypothetical protein WC484_05250 [Candidatus Omnitrophota bacterium]